jgi:hypothetical protein
MQNANVKGGAKDMDGDQVRTYGPIPLLNSILYDDEFPNGGIKQYSAMAIVYSQVDNHGDSSRRLTLLNSIVDFDYKRDGDAVPTEQMCVYTKSGQKRYRETTEGWPRSFYKRMNRNNGYPRLSGSMLQG